MMKDEKPSEELFKSAYHFFRSAFMDAPVAIEYYDLDGNIVMSNKATFELFGVQSPEDVKGFNMFDDPNLDDSTKQKLREGKPFRHSLKFSFDTVREHQLYPTSKTGDVYLDVSVIPFISNAGDHIGYLVYLLDVTSQKDGK
ncbi:MAG: PAS domain S-box protein [Sedimenticola sp.]